MIRKIMNKKYKRKRKLNMESLQWLSEFQNNTKKNGNIIIYRKYYKIENGVLEIEYTKDQDTKINDLNEIILM